MRTAGGEVGDGFANLTIGEAGSGDLHDGVAFDSILLTHHFAEKLLDSGFVFHPTKSHSPVGKGPAYCHIPVHFLADLPFVSRKETDGRETTPWDARAVKLASISRQAP